MVNRHRFARRRRLALDALEAANARSAPGERPAPGEIRLWLEGRVTPERAVEIDAHTALDPALHAEWLALRRAMLDENEGARERACRERPRRRDSPALATVVAIVAVLGAAVAVLLTDT